MYMYYIYHPSGHGLSLQHIRYNSDCAVYEELEPIDENLKYDFDYQQFTHLRHEVLVKCVSPLYIATKELVVQLQTTLC